MKRLNKGTIICAAILVAVFALSLTLRIAIPWQQVFSGQWIKFTDNDAYFFVRLLDNISAHFPLLGSTDPYFAFSGGDLSYERLFYVYFMGFFTWLFGAGAPSQHVVDIVGVYFPAILGALLVFPVFFIGKTVFNKWAGLVAALFIALIPGEFLARTLLGNTDIHVLELFLSTLSMLFIMLAARSANGIPVYPFSKSTLRKLTRPLIYGGAAGLCLGLYLLSWPGALFFVLISFVWLVVQFILDHFHGRPDGALGVTAAVWYFIALLISLFLTAGANVWQSLGVAVVASLALPLISWYMQRRSLRPGLYPLAVLIAAVLGLLSILVVRPQFLQFAHDGIASFFTWNRASTISESQPLLFNQGSFTLALTWGNYTTGTLMGLAGLAALVYLVIKEGKPGQTLLLTWSILALLAALALRRFAYYLAIDIALLSGYTGWLILKACGLKEPAAPVPAAPVASLQPRKKKGKATHRKGSAGPAARPALTVFGIIAVAFIAIYPNTGPLPGGDRPFYDVATRALYAPSDAWCETLNWMRTNTPEPFGDPQYYYSYYKTPVTSGDKARPAYSVVCWWDYGYWIPRIAHRVPYSNPGTAQAYEPFIFTAQDSNRASALGALVGMRYLIINDYVVNWESGFPIIATDAQNQPSKYFEIYYRQQGGTLSPTLLYYPEYYRTTAVRLYCFDGKAYTPSETAVISWESRTGADGHPYKEITGLKTFRSYTDAQDFVDTQKTGNFRIVGKDPNVSPVPLEEFAGFKPVYGSSQKSKIGTAQISEVKVFEFSK